MVPAVKIGKEEQVRIVGGKRVGLKLVLFIKKKIQLLEVWRRRERKR